MKWCGRKMNEKQYIRIVDLNNYIKLLFEDNTFLRKVYLKGEISNYKNHSSGHLYFTLKDEESKISAIMFRNKVVDLKMKPEDGKKVLVEGRISCYPSQGTYQIYVEKMEEDGLGNLYVLYEQLKKQLEQEGLFRPEHKKALPKYPEKIGVVTAPNGAAIKDIMSTIKRRYPLCEVILFPALVQGRSAAPDIVKQIYQASKMDLDVLIVGRGGGSIEDLWAFNEEIVARAIYDCPIPVISAVGHEVDFTIADFVADLRAPTPTGAAEMAVPTLSEVKNDLLQRELRIRQMIQNQLEMSFQQLGQLKESYILKNPLMLYDAKMHRFDYAVENLQKWMNTYLIKKQNDFQKVSSAYILRNPLQVYLKKAEFLSQIKDKMQYHIFHLKTKKEHELELMINTLKLVNPLNILEKGFTLVEKENHVIKNKNFIHVGDDITIRFKDGTILANVKEVE